tara:strand:+ start:3567 stop:3755 length:189 start_codon:yes stop_codon:yes gene_type:complete
MASIKDTQAELVAHERECAERYKAFNDKMTTLDKRLWRLEAMVMASIVSIVSLCVTIFMRIG